MESLLVKEKSTIPKTRSWEEENKTLTYGMGTSGSDNPEKSPKFLHSQIFLYQLRLQKWSTLLHWDSILPSLNTVQASRLSKTCTLVQNLLTLFQMATRAYNLAQHNPARYRLGLKKSKEATSQMTYKT